MMNDARLFVRRGDPRTAENLPPRIWMKSIAIETQSHVFLSVARRFAEASPTPGLVRVACFNASLIEKGSAETGAVAANKMLATTKYADFILAPPRKTLQKNRGQSD